MFVVWSRDKGLGARFMHLAEAMDHVRFLAKSQPNIKFHVFQAHGWVEGTPEGDLIQMSGRESIMAA